MSDRCRVLVADDDPASAELLTYFLESNGFEVSTAADGNRALEMGSSGDYLNAWRLNRCQKGGRKKVVS